MPDTHANATNARNRKLVHTNATPARTCPHHDRCADDPSAGSPIAAARCRTPRRTSNAEPANVAASTANAPCGPNPAIITLFFFQAEDGIRDLTVTGVQTCALPI